ncbi:hypothetical protein CEUSTIGMA_g2011.t1 [Chlamydomonas eustigma]|uniref:Uncharacterized protein n=1 Tax=Chlamydomonas eustigma TaxID=1157962 RepID=A0A250WVB6_9CHLO|nr:hypothetical protein CEUSTIGMA_g2011.t1 [Chlamydomonas eustigma]|eukprot:GAX74562.1 hypothetical protein CEUSTIGMA_g2011.t1 [Chlamydomonas eustigma]
MSQLEHTGSSRDEHVGSMERQVDSLQVVVKRAAKRHQWTEARVAMISRIMTGGALASAIKTSLHGSDPNSPQTARALRSTNSDMGITAHRRGSLTRLDIAHLGHLQESSSGRLKVGSLGIHCTNKEEQDEVWNADENSPKETLRSHVLRGVRKSSSLPPLPGSAPQQTLPLLGEPDQEDATMRKAAQGKASKSSLRSGSSRLSPFMTTSGHGFRAPRSSSTSSILLSSNPLLNTAYTTQLRHDSSRRPSSSSVAPLPATSSTKLTSKNPGFQHASDLASPSLELYRLSEHPAENARSFPVPPGPSRLRVPGHESFKHEIATKKDHLFEPEPGSSPTLTAMPPGDLLLDSHTVRGTAQAIKKDAQAPLTPSVKWTHQRNASGQQRGCFMSMLMTLVCFKHTISPQDLDEEHSINSLPSDSAYQSSLSKKHLSNRSDLPTHGCDKLESNEGGHGCMDDPKGQGMSKLSLTITMPPNRNEARHIGKTAWGTSPGHSLGIDGSKDAAVQGKSTLKSLQLQPVRAETTSVQEVKLVQVTGDLEEMAVEVPGIVPSTDLNPKGSMLQSPLSPQHLERQEAIRRRVNFGDDVAGGSSRPGSSKGISRPQSAKLKRAGSRSRGGSARSSRAHSTRSSRAPSTRNSNQHTENSSETNSARSSKSHVGKDKGGIRVLDLLEGLRSRRRSRSRLPSMSGEAVRGMLSRRPSMSGEAVKGMLSRMPSMDHGLRGVMKQMHDSEDDEDDDDDKDNDDNNEGHRIGGQRAEECQDERTVGRVDSDEDGGRGELKGVVGRGSSFGGRLLMRQLAVCRRVQSSQGGDPVVTSEDEEDHDNAYIGSSKVSEQKSSISQHVSESGILHRERSREPACLSGEEPPHRVLLASTSMEGLNYAKKRSRAGSSYGQVLWGTPRSGSVKDAQQELEPQFSVNEQDELDRAQSGAGDLRFQRQSRMGSLHELGPGEQD